MTKANLSFGRLKDALVAGCARRLLAAVLAQVLALCGFGIRSSAQPGTAGHAATIDACRYADDAAAQAAWEPMRGTAPVTKAVIGGVEVLRLPCRFKDSPAERASWDRKVKLDLASCRGVEFKLLCRDASPVSHFSIYFQSGEGWYHAAFFPESSADWNTVVIDKTEATIEGRPAGWGQIETIRISAWRGKDVDTEFYLRDLRQAGTLGADATVAIIRAESVALSRPDERRNALEYAEQIAETLGGLGVGCAVLSDLEVTPEQLKPARLVILPHNPSMPDSAVEHLIQYLGQGGSLVAFYTVPARLRPVLGMEGGRHLAAERPGQFSAIRFAEGALPGAPAVVGQRSWNINALEPIPGATRALAEWLDDKNQPTGRAAVLGGSNFVVMTHVLLRDDAANKGRMLLAMAGSLVPELWRQAAEAAIARIGSIENFSGYENASNRIARLSGESPRVIQTLASARALRDSARNLAARREFAQALDEAAAADRQVKEAFCQAQRAEPGEFRAFWCHSAFGVAGMEWDEAIRRLAQNGFTAILPNMLWGGAAFYPSKVLPVSPQVSGRGDQIAQCLAACRKYGLQMHVWKVNWNLGAAAPKEFVDRLRAERRLQANAQGKEQLWLCPSNPENQKLEVESLVEVVRNYGVDGIHFDYIRYPDADHCYCAGCRERFERARNAPVPRWPQDVLAEGPLGRAWLDWRRGNITAVVRAVSEQARALRPGIAISAAVFPNWTTDRDSVGQDWKLWCERGYVDFVCPMDYTPLNGVFENMVARQVQWAGRTPCFPGIGVSASSSHFGVDRVIDQIHITRRHHTHGFVIFNYGPAESRDLLPLLGLGITRR